MAGLYGHERANRPTSEAIYQLSWSKLVSDPRHTGRILATGYSCRSQASLMDGANLPHPIQILLSRVKAGEPQVQVAQARSPAAVRPEHHEEY